MSASVEAEVDPSGFKRNKVVHRHWTCQSYKGVFCLFGKTEGEGRERKGRLRLLFLVGEYGVCG